MKLTTWINKQVQDHQVVIKELEEFLATAKLELKNTEKLKKSIGRLSIEKREPYEELDLQITSYKFKIENLKSKISGHKDAIAELNYLSKQKPIRLKTGAVISLKRLEEMQKKLKGFEITVIQSLDGIQIKYRSEKTQTSGKFTLLLLNVVEIPEEVELPIYEEGEVVEGCLIFS